MKALILLAVAILACTSCSNDNTSSGSRTGSSSNAVTSSNTRSLKPESQAYVAELDKQINQVHSEITNNDSEMDILFQQITQAMTNDDSLTKAPPLQTRLTNLINATKELEKAEDALKLKKLEFLATRQ